MGEARRRVLIIQNWEATDGVMKFAKLSELRRSHVTFEQTVEGIICAEENSRDHQQLMSLINAPLDIDSLYLLYTKSQFN